jgi:hypothetical protein
LGRTVWTTSPRRRTKSQKLVQEALEIEAEEARADDARRMDNQITARGRALLKRLDEPVRHAIRSQLHGAGKKKLAGLAGLLEDVRLIAKEAG